MMKKLLISCVVMIMIPLCAFAQIEPKASFSNGICTTMEMDALLRANNPSMGSLEDFEQRFQIEISRYKEGLSNGRIAEEVLTIPVVVHVIHNGEAVGTGPNIRSNQVQSQIDAFTEHFRKRGSGANDSPVGADIQIEFAPAIWDPNGQRMLEPGVDRYDGGKEGWDQGAIQAILKEETIWDPNKYFNVWTVNFGNNSEGLLGYAQFPSSSGLDGLGENEGSGSTDGVVMNYMVFGTTPNVPRPYHEGKVASHEVGHWLGLRHIWGDGGCSVDDYCEDTPNASGAGWSKAFLGCPADNECGDGDRPVDNYMDYSDDPCKKVFTQNQKTRIRTVMDVSPRRKELKESRVHLERDTPYTYFTSNQTIGCEGTVIQFTDTSSNSPTSWAWSFYNDDGNLVGVSTDQNPQQQFDEIGHYDVELTASNTSGSSTLRREHYIGILSVSLVAEINEDFETPDLALGNWLIYNPDDDEAFQSASVSAYGIGSNAIYFKNIIGDEDPSGTIDALVTPPLDFTTFGNPYLTFDHAYAVYGAGIRNDSLAILYSTDCGETYAPLWYKGGADLATAEGSLLPFVPTPDEWDSTKISLEALKGFSQVHLAFANVSDGGNNLYLDNLVVGDLAGSSLPEPVTIRTSDTVICQGGFVRFEDQTPGFPTSWNWTFEGGSPATSTEQNPAVQYTVAGKFDVTLQVTNSVGDVTETFDTLISVMAQPLVAITPDQMSYCPGDEITLTANGAEAYYWFDERSIDPVSEDNPYTFKLFESRTYYLLGENLAGCKDTTSLFIDLDDMANVSISPSDTIACEGSTVIFTGSGAESYIWLTKNDTLSTEPTLELTLEKSMIVGLVGNVTSGCPGFYYAEVSVDASPTAEVVQDVLQLTASEAASYQWFLDDEEIPGATNQVYTAEISGTYHVVLTNLNDCSDGSEGITIEIVTGLEELGISANLSAYPNPTTGRFSLQITGQKTGIFDYQMSDISGKIIQVGTFDKLSDFHHVELNLKNRSGLYLLKVSNGENAGIIKIVKK